MNFNVKLEDAKIKVDLSTTQLRDVLVYCKPKESLVLVKKFWLGNNEKCLPLQRIGQEYNLTRERMRQIESQALMRFRRLIVGNEKYISVLSEAKKILEAHGCILSEDVLISKLINRNMFNFNKAELKLILVSDFDILYLKRNRVINKSFYVAPLFEDLLTKMVLFVNNYFSKRKEPQDLYEFIAEVKNEFSQEYKEVECLRNDLFYINFFSVIKGIAIFDGRIGFESFPDVAPKTMKLKIYYTMKKINKAIHYQELPAKILDWFPNQSVKINTIHNELVKNNDIFVNLWLGLYGLKEWGYQGGVVKDILIRVLEKFDRPMSVKDLCKEVLKEKMVSPSTVNMNLQKYSDCFERTGKGVYQLRKGYNA